MKPEMPKAGSVQRPGSALESAWRQPPPGTSIIKAGTAQKGDWFYIQHLGAWAPVPEIGWGEPITGALVARGSLDTTQVEAITTRAMEDLAWMTTPPNSESSTSKAIHQSGHIQRIE